MSTARLPRSARFVALVTTLCALAALPSSRAFATSVVRLSDQQLVRMSSIIAEGRVTSVRSEWNADRTQIHTLVVIRVGQTHKGSVPTNGLLVLRLMGGRVGDLAFVIAGQPTFTVDEDVIAFVGVSGPDLYPITGLDQGKFTIDIDARTGTTMVRERSVSRDVFVRGLTRLVEDEGRR